MTDIVKPTWAKKAVVYQIYPRSFKDTNGDGIGDIKGIIEKLDYLNDGTDTSLGVDAIWLSPIYQSPMRDFGYDVSDHCAIDPIFGSMEDFDLLIKTAHERGVKVLMDFIPGHTSSDHPWFLESRSSKDNPKRDWYIWKDAKPDGSPPNNWVANFGGSRWVWDESTKQYYLRTFLEEQPDLNWRNPEVREAQLQVLRFWLEKGVDGFRVDSFNDVYKDERFLDEPDNPEYQEGIDIPFKIHTHIYTRNQPERNDMVKLLSSVLAEYGDKFMLTESYVELVDLVALYEAGDSSHAPFNFEFIHLPWNAQAYRKFLDELYVSVPPDYIHTFVLGNHDRPRVASRIGEPAARTAAMLQLTLHGMPIMYYGDELGMVDTPIPPERIQDPLGRYTNGAKAGRDPQRTPMQWNSSEFGGFSTVEPWLPMGSNASTHTVENESSTPLSLLSFYKRLLAIRRASQALLSGTYRSITIENEHIFAYVRDTAEETMLIVLNFSNLSQSFRIEENHAASLVLSSIPGEGEGRVDLKHLMLMPYEGRVYRTDSL